MDVKDCTGCGRTLPLDEFYSFTDKGKTRRRAKCKRCWNASRRGKAKKPRPSAASEPQASERTSLAHPSASPEVDQPTDITSSVQATPDQSLVKVALSTDITSPIDTIQLHRYAQNLFGEFSV